MAASTVILGTGIIGLSTAYYLADHQPGSTIHLVDSSAQLFASASGYAGGFLASSDWFHPHAAALGALSFEEHTRLAQRHGGREKWGYTRSVSVSYDARGRTPGRASGEKDWLREGRSRADVVSERERQVSSGDVPRWLRRVDGDAVNVMDNGDGTAIL